MRFAQDDSFDGGDAIVLWDVVQRYEKMVWNPHLAVYNLLTSDL